MSRIACRLPPLKALAAFEAASRHMNLARAAEELNVTPSAVSHQVRNLEAYLGTRLFERRSGRLALTEPGLAYFERVTGALLRIAEATERLTGQCDAENLAVQSSNGFATKWLLPRLPDFLARHPGIRMRVNATSDPAAFALSRPPHVAICYGSPPSNSVEIEPILLEEVQPLCSPSLLAGSRPLCRPEDLCHHRLIHSCNLLTWESWLKRNGLGEVSAEALWFDRSAMAIEAAVNGVGVVLESDVLTDAERADGRLVAPFAGPGIRHRLAAHYLVCPPPYTALPQVVKFREWLRGTFAA